MNPIAVYKNVGLGPELSTTPVAGANDTVIGANVRKYTFFTFPSASTFYLITGIEWLNGTVVNGNTDTGVETVNANPPSANFGSLLAWGVRVPQAGASAVQRQSLIFPGIIKGGALVGAYIGTASATGRYGTTTVGSANNQLSVGGSATLQQGTTWAASTEEAYIKVYYKAVA